MIIDIIPDIRIRSAKLLIEDCFIECACLTYDIRREGATPLLDKLVGRIRDQSHLALCLSKRLDRFGDHELYDLANAKDTRRIMDRVTTNPLECVIIAQPVWEYGVVVYGGTFQEMGDLNLQ